jgi:hypothetical protein
LLLHTCLLGDLCVPSGATQNADLDGWERFFGYSFHADLALGYLRSADLRRNNSTKSIWDRTGYTEGGRG